jgi:hypothetical protein
MNLKLNFTIFLEDGDSKVLRNIVCDVRKKQLNSFSKNTPDEERVI